MTPAIYAKAEMAAALRETQEQVATLVAGMSEAQFNQTAAAGWPASGYLKHLILSIKPLAKAMKLPPEQLRKMFGQPEQPSRSYDEVVAMYRKRIDEGIKAEDYTNVTPDFYRIPEGVADEKAYFLDTWNESNQRLLAALEAWTEDDLDQCQIPHPGIGSAITVREMMLFTVYHNRLHAQDMQQAALASL